MQLCGEETSTRNGITMEGFKGQTLAPRPPSPAEELYLFSSPLPAAPSSFQAKPCPLREEDVYTFARKTIQSELG